MLILHVTSSRFCVYLLNIYHLSYTFSHAHTEAHTHKQRKWQENGENMNLISEHRLVRSQLGRAMNWVDRLRTSADERVLSGRRAVVIA